MTPSYALGLFFILCVSIIWSLASIVVQFLYTDQHFDSPFLLTYIGTSLFILLLPTRLIWERRRRCCGRGGEGEGDSDITLWKSDRGPSYEHIPGDPSSDTEMIQLPEDQEDENDRGKDNDMVEQQGGERASGAIPEVAADEQRQGDISEWSHHDHIQAAARIALVWFLANWSYNASLAYTSITSSTVLASTGSLFTFMFAVLWGDEAFTCFKLTGVLLGVTGSILTGWNDVGSSSSATLDDDLWNNTAALSSSAACVAAGHMGTPHHIKPTSNTSDPWEGHALWGDALGLLSAVGYGAYAVMIRLLCPHDERCMSMQLLLGYIGLFNAVLLSPIAVYILVWPEQIPQPHQNGGDDDATTSEQVVQRLTLVVFGYLVAKGMLDNVLSDYLWARAVVLTSATVATVGLGLTIPLAFASDWIMGHSNVASMRSILGAVSVLAGFVFVNLDNKEGAVAVGTDPGESVQTSDFAAPASFEAID